MTATKIRHIDLYRTDDAYRVLSDAENYWHNRANAITDGAEEGVSMATCDRFESKCKLERLAYLSRHNIQLGA